MPDLRLERHVVHLGGYDPMTAEAFHARFQRELGRFERCWGVKAGTSDLVIGPEMASWTVTVSGPGWTVETRHDLLRWDDVIAGHRAGGTAARLWHGFGALADFVLNGALWGYLRVAWRYALFLLYPFLVLLALLALGWLVGRLSGAIGLPPWLGALIGGGTAAGLIVQAVRHTHIGHLLDDWIFASRQLRAPDSVIAGRIDSLAGALAGEPRRLPLLVVGHSLGAVLAVELIDAMLARQDRPRTVDLLTLGSSILKLALHRRAKALRAALARVNGSGLVRWSEYQAVNDIMNFYGVDTVKVLSLPGPSPVTRKVRFRHMLSPGYYARIRHNFFRLHCQFISGNDLRARYDYFVTICGPFDPMALAGSRDGAVGWIAADGSLTEEGRRHLLGQAATMPQPAGNTP